MIIAPDDNDQRLDRFLKKTFPMLTFGQTQKLIRTGQIRLNGKRCKADTRMNEGDELRLPPSLAHGDANKPKIHFSQKDRDFISALVLFEDETMLVLNKPAGLAVQGGSKTKIHIDDMLNSYIKKNGVGKNGGCNTRHHATISNASGSKNILGVVFARAIRK
jgi:23S rRNA pseudouridine955/2504/2580 synthase